MKNSKLNTRRLVVIGALSAVTIILGMIPGIGFIPIGVANATILHIPVIIGAVLEGPVVGMFVGLIFGLFSMIRALTTPTPVSFVFMNPLIAILPRVLIGLFSYYAYAGVKKLGTEKSRFFFNIIIGVISLYLIYQIYQMYQAVPSLNQKIIISFVLLIITLGIAFFINKKYAGQSFDVMVGAAAGTATNTFFVLSLIYLFYGQRFVEAIGKDSSLAATIIAGIAVTNGIPEIIVAIILTVAVVNGLRRVKRLN